MPRVRRRLICADRPTDWRARTFEYCIEDTVLLHSPLLFRRKIYRIICFFPILAGSCLIGTQVSESELVGRAQCLIAIDGRVLMLTRYMRLSFHGSEHSIFSRRIIIRGGKATSVA